MWEIHQKKLFFGKYVAIFEKSKLDYIYFIGSYISLHHISHMIHIYEYDIYIYDTHISYIWHIYLIYIIHTIYLHMIYMWDISDNPRFHRELKIICDRITTYSLGSIGGLIHASANGLVELHLGQCWEASTGKKGSCDCWAVESLL